MEVQPTFLQKVFKAKYLAQTNLPINKVCICQKLCMHGSEFFLLWTLYLGIEMSDKIILHYSIVSCEQLYALPHDRVIQLAKVKKLACLKLQFKAI